MTEEEKVIVINLETLYKEVVDEWAVYDNSSEWPVLIEEGGKS
jgi:predicted ABC-type ATPase